MKHCISLTGAAAIFAAAAVLSAGPAAATIYYQVANVGAPAINCFYAKDCKVIVSDSISKIPLTGITGTARLQTRTFVGAPGTPAAGKMAFLYRVDLTDAVRVSAASCVKALRVFNLGTNDEVVKFDYDKNGTIEGVFAITSGGLGTIGVANAETFAQFDVHIQFNFTKPVCAAGSAGEKGDSSHFFGLTSVFSKAATGNADALQTSAITKATKAFDTRVPIKIK